MITPIKRLNRLLMLATAPFVGIIFCLLLLQQPLVMEFSEPVEHYVPTSDIRSKTEGIKSDLDTAKALAESTSSSIKRTTELYNSTSKTMQSIANMTTAQAKKPEAIYDRRIQAKLGVPYEVVDSKRIHIELFKVNPGTYQGYAMKIKLKDPTAMQMALDDELGSSQTTLQAALRSGAVAGINAGGYAESGGKRYPLSTTVQDGKYVTGFHASMKDLAFVGMNKEGKLIGGKFFSKYALDQQEPVFGATFVPMLMKNGNKTIIPSKWKNTPRRAPRTVIGNYKDDQLLILVIDGYNEKGSSGATLEELQHKMYTLGVQDAYNLDGGGSTSLVLNGKVVNEPSDGNLRKVPTHFLFYE